MRLPEEMIQEKQDEQTVLPRQKKKSTRNLTEAEHVQKSFRKIRRRWALSLAVLPSLLILLGLGIMVADEIRGEGLAFTNLYDFGVSWRFVRLVDKGEYEKAVDMVDYTDSYQSLQDTLSGKNEVLLTEEDRQFYLALFGDVLNMTYEEFAELERQKLVNYLQEEDAMNRVKHYGYGRAYRMSDGNWEVGASMSNAGFLEYENGERMYDENGELIRLWHPADQFALDGAFFRNFTREVWRSGEIPERFR